MSTRGYSSRLELTCHVCFGLIVLIVCPSVRLVLLSVTRNVLVCIRVIFEISCSIEHVKANVNGGIVGVIQ